MNRHVLLLIVTAVLWSLGGVLIKSIDWNPLAISGGRSAIAVVVLGTFFPSLWRKISWKALPGALAYTDDCHLICSSDKAHDRSKRHFPSVHSSDLHCVARTVALAGTRYQI